MVDPETQAHVGIVHEAEDSTTGHVLVLVHVTVLERHSGYATQQVNVDELASSGGTSCRISEHEMLSEVNNGCVHEWSSKAWSGTRTLVHAGACQTPMSILVCRLWVGGDGVTVTQCNIQAGRLVKHLLVLRSAAVDCTSPSQRIMKLSRF